MAASSTARPVRTYEDAERMLRAKCSLEAFQERMLSSEFDVARHGDRLYKVAWLPANRPIRAWLRSADFAARVGAIEWEDPLGVFFDACEDGDEEYVSRVGKEHPEWLDKGCEHYGVSTLHVACEGGLMRFVPDLVCRFGDVDVKDSSGRSPLFYACWGGNFEVFEYLMSVGANARVESRHHETMLHAACEGGSLANVRALLGMGLDVNARSAQKECPLHLACQYAEQEVVSTLVEHGADVRPSDSPSGKTPLHVAGRAGKLAIVRFLVERGVPLEGTGNPSPLLEALRLAQMQVVKYLESVGAGLESIHTNQWEVVRDILSCDSAPAMEWLLSREVVSVSEALIDRCLREGRGDFGVLRYLLLHEQSAPFLSHVDVSLLPDGFLGECASLSKWREHELRMELRYLMLSWRRGFVVSRLEV
jgi:ankyrin repeat protein